MVKLADTPQIIAVVATTRPMSPATTGANPLSPIRALAEACLRFTPLVAVREGEAVFLDVTRTTHLFGGVAAILPRLQVLAGRFGLPVSIAAATDAPTALAMARYRRADAKTLPLDALSDYASPFEVDSDVLKKAHALASTLQLLGLRTLEDFSRLPSGTLASRFGAAGVELSAMIRAAYSRPWPAFRPAETVTEQADLRDPETLGAVPGLEPLLFVLRGLAERALSRLRGHGLRAAKIEILCELERAGYDRRGAQRRWVLELPLAQGSASGLLPILRERLAFDTGMRPLESPATHLRFTVLETAPGHGAQRHFFDRTEEEAEAWDELVGRLSSKLGGMRAFAARMVDRHLPEGAWEPAKPERIGTARAESCVPLARQCVARPARVLRDPEPLKQLGDTLLHCALYRRWRIVEWHGPERLSGEWWLSRAFERDYYRAVADTGEELWVFSTPQSVRFGSFFLHGYFD